MSTTGPQLLETTQDLVEMTRAGDGRAQERLIRRYLPLITRWAHGRLPSGARDLNDTGDLVQLALLRAFQSLPSFQMHGRGAFYGFLRTVLQNLLRDEARRAGRRPGTSELTEGIAESGDSPLQTLLSEESLSAYESALRRLDPSQQELIVMRVELGFSHEEIAQITESPSPNAARMRVTRALAHLAELMKDHSGLLKSGH